MNGCYRAVNAYTDRYGTLATPVSARIHLQTPPLWGAAPSLDEAIRKSTESAATFRRLPRKRGWMRDLHPTRRSLPQNIPQIAKHARGVRQEILFHWGCLAADDCCICRGGMTLLEPIRR